MGKQIQVRIYPDGKIEAKTIGAKGEKCKDYIPLLEHVLKARVVETMHTDEYYQQETSLENNEFIQTLDK